MLARILPFGLYMLFLLVSQTIGWFGQTNEWQPSLTESIQLWIYPIKTLVVVTALLCYWGQYDELPWPPHLSFSSLMLAIGTGVLVYLAWVRMDWAWAVQGERSAGYNPFLQEGTSGSILAAFRLFGAAIVVPIMEELFWRSFLMRYLISSRFETILLGTITPLSFGLTIVLFGIEHDLWLAGMMAGTAYGLLLARTQNLWTCVIAHGITNLALGIHVLVTHEWYWW